MCFAPQRRALFQHFFDIWTSKSGPNMVCFVHFAFQMCFAPQRRALFRHRNFQKWSENGFVHFDFKMCFAPQRRALFHLFRHLNFQKWSETLVFLTFWLRSALRATTAYTFSTSEPPKMVRTPGVLDILTWTCASRHNDVHFLNISTSKSGPRMVCFVHFDFKMCFAPQRRALFRHLNFQKWSENGVFCTFWLQNVLRATTACTFSTSQLPKVVRSSSVLSILTWKCASRHNGVHFFMSHLASWLRTRRFSEPTFRPSGATNHWKNSESRLSYLFAHLPLLSSDLFSSDSSHLCFSTVHIVGSFTSKLPSNNKHINNNIYIYIKSIHTHIYI